LLYLRLLEADEHEKKEDVSSYQKEQFCWDIFERCEKNRWYQMQLRIQVLFHDTKLNMSLNLGVYEEKLQFVMMRDSNYIFYHPSNRFVSVLKRNES
jgi:hypothetical protein